MALEEKMRKNGKPKTAEYYLKTGGEFVNRGNFDGAIDHYNEAIDVEPDCVEAWCHRGTARDVQSRILMVGK